MSFARQSVMKAVMKELLANPAGMTYSEIWNIIAREGRGFTKETHPRLFTKNGNFNNSLYSADFKGWVRLRCLFLNQNGRLYTMRYNFTPNQIDQMKFWSKDWDNVAINAGAVL